MAIRRTNESRRERIAKDALWLLFAVAALSFFVAGLIGLFSPKKSFEATDLIQIAFPAVFSYWLGMGAWRRTSWAQRRHAMPARSTSET